LTAVRAWRVFVPVLGLTLVAVPATAQTPTAGEPPADVRVRVGPLFANPSLSLTNAGIDTNVFNEPDQVLPKQDFTMTVTPATDVWLRFGPTWLSANIREDLVYYNTYASERSANTGVKSMWLIPLNRLTLKPSLSYLITRERPGFEIDARARHTDLGYGGLVEVRALAKTFFGVRGERHEINFDQGAVFLGANLDDQLTRTVTTGGVSLRNQLTPLTSVTLDAAREQDRFSRSPLRDSDSTLVSFGVTFDPAALIKGSATFGYRDFRPLTPGVPGFQGGTIAVDLSYVALGATRLGVQATRDVQYSYDVNQPYYVQTGIAGSIQQQIFGPIDAVARAGAQRLAYRDRSEAPVAVANRADHVRGYGGGVGYHLGRDLRIGVNIDRQRRESPIDFRQYDGTRYGVSVTYGS